jgi:hypothetical protein
VLVVFQVIQMTVPFQWRNNYKHHARLHPTAFLFGCMQVCRWITEGFTGECIKICQSIRPVCNSNVQFVDFLNLQ